MVFRHLRDLARARPGRLSYFRPDDDLELDFVIEIDGRKVGLEVTSTSSVRPRKLARVQRAAEALGAEHVFIVHGGISESADGEVIQVPLSRFLLAPGRIVGEGDS